ncbi:MAG TPA: SRPBCC domain-containing protein [Flavipsychrobacter sp.]|nr:SRPBCC domain-containing protein [Flavipsychrobacter sp.]
MKNFKKYIKLPATPEEVYLALTRATSLQLWTGATVEFEEKAETEFSLWDGDIVGKNLEFDYGKKIVQQWYFGEDNAPSLVTIKLHEDKEGTSMEFAQTNIPSEDFEDFTEGLGSHYFEGLRDFFEED